jgi:hypothetical protein
MADVFAAAMDRSNADLVVARVDDGPMPCIDGEIPLAPGHYTLSVTVDGHRGEMHGLTRD